MEKPMPQGLNPSRITKLLSSNDAPTGPERAILKTVALKGAEYLSVLQQRISSTRETLYALLEEQSRQIKSVVDAKELLNPIRRLPEDVLLKIFTACIPTRIEEMIYASPGEFDSLDVKNAPWVLSQVCASWRRTTLANPRLWSSISLVMDKYTNHMGCIFRFGILLARTKTHPLMVCIDANADIALHPLLAMVLPTSSRWSNLSVTAPLRSFLPFNNISHALPLLQLLDIRVTGQDSSEGGLESTRIVHGFQHAPNLCRLNLDLNSQELHPFSRWLVLPMDSEKLSRLNAFTTPFDAASLLNWHGAKNAKEFCLAMLNYPPQLQQQVEVSTIRHALLQNLSVTESASESTPGSIAELVSHLRLPALQKLTLIYKDSTIFLPAIDQHTAPLLTDLEILSDPPTTLDENSVIEMLKWTPRLRHLELAVKFMTPNVFIALGDVEDGAFKLIHFLETISLMGAQFQFDDHGRVITDMVEARFSAEDEDEAGPFFEEIYLDEEVGDEERWEKLCHGGLNVFVIAS
ncbi:uncharacterized protein EV420DRAFT_1688701 [Desarmillaria tabescens]|uniref:F-box domain-containing protein n=1 Tax=Armillaria tabescens TaxID=1929756 RepID=A0AA39KAG1_ARMTA|nr:uncharacterized protein EV420DRAFT_1688701 [Desarmillaria tabescens]KAK0457480.1 hypothetical protein EV420DRAFT_1688701 [Desarmillaria tabescens]